MYVYPWLINSVLFVIIYLKESILTCKLCVLYGTYNDIFLSRRSAREPINLCFDRCTDSFGRLEHDWERIFSDAD